MIISQCCNLQQTCKPWKNSKALNLLWSITTTQHKKIQQKASDTKKKRTEKWFTLEKPNHPTLHIQGEQSGARLRLHLLSHCPYPTKSVWIWPPFHNSVQKKVPVKQPPQTHPSVPPVGGSPLVVVHPSQELFLTIALKLLLLALFCALCMACSYWWHAWFHTPCTWLQHLVLIVWKTTQSSCPHTRMPSVSNAQKFHSCR